MNSQNISVNPNLHLIFFCKKKKNPLKNFSQFYFLFPNSLQIFKMLSVCFIKYLKCHWEGGRKLMMLQREVGELGVHSPCSSHSDCLSIVEPLWQEWPRACHIRISHSFVVTALSREVGESGELNLDPPLPSWVPLITGVRVVRWASPIPSLASLCGAKQAPNLFLQAIW